VKIITNNQPRNIVDAYELTPAERAEFDYLDWDAIEAGSDSASFFRFKGTLYDLGEFTADYGITKGAGLPAHLADWDGYQADSFFSATVVRYVNDDQIVVGRIIS
jgi:hypothetical protein